MKILFVRSFFIVIFLFNSSVTFATENPCDFVAAAKNFASGEGQAAETAKPPLKYGDPDYGRSLRDEHVEMWHQENGLAEDTRQSTGARFSGLQDKVPPRAADLEETYVVESKKFVDPLNGYKSQFQKVKIVKVDRGYRNSKEPILHPNDAKRPETEVITVKLLEGKSEGKKFELSIPDGDAQGLGRYSPNHQKNLADMARLEQADKDAKVLADRIARAERIKEEHANNALLAKKSDFISTENLQNGRFSSKASQGTGLQGKGFTFHLQENEATPALEYVSKNHFKDANYEYVIREDGHLLRVNLDRKGGVSLETRVRAAKDMGKLDGAFFDPLKPTVQQWHESGDSGVAAYNNKITMLY